jgi:hypothetical protein
MIRDVKDIVLLYTGTGTVYSIMVASYSGSS